MLRAFSDISDAVYNLFSGKKEPFWGYPAIEPGPVYSTYRHFSEADAHARRGKIIVGFHYVPWETNCKLVAPIWEAIKSDFMPKKMGGGYLPVGDPNADWSGIVLIEHNEEEGKTEGVESVPALFRYEGGKLSVYKGPFTYKRIREWILNVAPPHN